MFLSWVFYLAVFLRFSYGFWGRGELAGGYAQTSFQIRAQRIFGVVPLGLQKKPCPENQSPGSESWSVLCTGGSAGAALCVEDMTVLRNEKGISSAA